MLVIWTGADTPLIKKIIGPVVARESVAHRVCDVGDKLPPAMAGDVVLACGNKAVDILRQVGAVGKKLTLGSLREKPIEVGGVTYLATYDPLVTQRDYALLPELQWDIMLASRLVRTGSLVPELGDYQFVDDLSEIIDAVDAAYEKTGAAVPVACDLETLGLDEYAPDAWIVSISFTVKEGQSRILYFESDEAPEPPSNPMADLHELPYWQALWVQINWLLTTPKVKITGANFKYDWRWLSRQWGIDCTNFVFDTLLVGSLLDENRSNSLKLHAKLYTPIGGYEDSLGDYDMGRMDLVPKPQFKTYAGGDTDAQLRVYTTFRKELMKDRALTSFYVNLLHPSSRVFAKVERTGILVDVPYMHQLEAELSQEKSRLAKEMLDCVPWKLRHKYSDKITRQLDDEKSPFLPSFLKEFLFTKNGLNLTPVMFTDKTQEPSTSKHHLLRLADDPDAANFIKLFSEYNSASKTLSSHVVGFMKHLRSDGRFHPHYMLYRGGYGDDDDDSGTNSGRTSAKDPAVQCCVPETRVLTDKGWMQLIAIVEGHEAGEPYKVLTHTGHWRDVVGVYRNGAKPVFKVTLRSGKAITCTGNHPLLTVGGFVSTDRLTIGSFVYTIAPHEEGAWPQVRQRGEGHTDLSGMVEHAHALQQHEVCGLQELRGPWNYGSTGVVRFQQLPSGHGGVSPGLHAGARAGERGLPARQLLLDSGEPAGGEHAQYEDDHLQRGDAPRGGVGAHHRARGSAASSAEEGVVRGEGLDDAAAAHEAGFAVEEVVRIEPQGLRDTFDLTIDRCHSFVAEGIVVHNTIPKKTKWTKKLRRAYIAPPGKVILQLDFSQGELRITACIAEEPTMIEAYLNGIDLHALTASTLMGLELEEFMALDEEIRDLKRSGGKAGNFGLIYGMQSEGFRNYARNSYNVILSSDESMEFREKFFGRYGRLLEWHKEAASQAARDGIIRSPLGRVRHLPLIHSKEWSVKSKAERQAINAPVQSTLSDMMQLAMVLIDRQYPNHGIEMFLMTHDSVALFVPEDEGVEWAKKIKHIMENLPLKELFGWAPPLTFPADAELGPNLAELKKLKGL